MLFGRIKHGSVFSLAHYSIPVHCCKVWWLKLWRVITNVGILLCNTEVEGEEHCLTSVSEYETLSTDTV